MKNLILTLSLILAFFSSIAQSAPSVHQVNGYTEGSIYLRTRINAQDLKVAIEACVISKSLSPNQEDCVAIGAKTDYSIVALRQKFNTLKRQTKDRWFLDALVTLLPMFSEVLAVDGISAINYGLTDFADLTASNYVYEESLVSGLVKTPLATGGLIGTTMLFYATKSPDQTNAHSGTAIKRDPLMDRRLNELGAQLVEDKNRLINPLEVKNIAETIDPAVLLGKDTVVMDLEKFMARLKLVLNELDNEGL